MPQIVWRIEDERITLTDRAQMGVTLEVPGAQPMRIPPLVLGEWPFSFAGRRLELRSVRNLDRLRYQLWCEGHLLPRGEVDRRRPLGAMCATHASEAATCLCSRCRAPVCNACSPNGVHCAPCLDALADEDRRAALRARRLGIGLSLALGLGFAGAGLAVRSPEMAELGVATVILVAILYGRGVWMERRERKQGLPSAVDRK